MFLLNIALVTQILAFDNKLSKYHIILISFKQSTLVLILTWMGSSFWEACNIME